VVIKLKYSFDEIESIQTELGPFTRIVHDVRENIGSSEAMACSLGTVAIVHVHVLQSGQQTDHGAIVWTDGPVALGHGESISVD
jgi:hypothetical protein